MEGLTDIGALSREQMATIVAATGQATYRTRQLVRWLYGRGGEHFDQMSDLPAEFREALASRFFIGSAETAEKQESSDGTRKYLVRLADGATIEAVGLPDEDRLTVCFSVQAGCAMGCTFCATGRDGFVRDLNAGEMVRQIRLVQDDFGRRVTNVVAMGQGEPFANYDAVLAALRFMNADDGLGIGARHITVSTCGLLPGIARFAAEPEQFTLAISLHSAVSATRSRLMPGVQGVSLTALRRAIIGYADSTGRRPSLEYALIEGVNDTAAELEALVAFARGLLVHVNLIPVNPIGAKGVHRSEAGRARGGDRDIGSRRARCGHRCGLRPVASARREAGSSQGLAHVRVRVRVRMDDPAQAA
jgi:23S rRNA (adenine2503-C2)-methyltransferase